MSHLAVTAIGRDRPGIVAGISEALLELEGNIEDSRMAILGGHFAVMLVVTVPERDEGEVRARLEAAGRELGLSAVTVAPVGPGAAEPAAATHVLTVYGADHPGIVHAVTTALAELDVNVTDLSTRLGGSEEQPVYAMFIEIAVPEPALGQVEGRMREVGEATDVEVSLRSLDAEAL